MADQVVVVNAQEWARLPTRLVLTLVEVAEKSGIQILTAAGDRMSVTDILSAVEREFNLTCQTGLAPSERTRQAEFARPADEERRWLDHVEECPHCLPNWPPRCDEGRTLMGKQSHGRRED
jgi:hypothetical protein